jgi:pyruvate/2-oxoglutarate dehydrogenase complex dihydrolipoamide dehydrogenase (E3) component/uncharacterized membrane protein YdjX (TVP38/TMEM64 family)
MRPARIALLTVLVALIAAFFIFDIARFLNLDFLRASQDGIADIYAEHPILTAAIFFAVYVVSTALSVPGALVLTVASGAIFGLLWGTLLVSFASTIGATLAFLASRFLFRDAVRRSFGRRVEAIDAGLAKEGAFYLFALRLVPVFPFFLINLGMGLTAIPVRTFYWTSQAGTLLGTLVYVNAGTQIAKIESVRGLLSPGLIAAFIVLGFFPIVARRIVAMLQSRRVYSKWKRPARFDRNLIVIGAGSAGLVSAYIAAAVKAKVTLVEKHRMGGDCLNTGCVPSKALIRTTRFLAQARGVRNIGLRSASVDYDFGEVMERVQKVVAEIEPHDSIERYTSLGVECLQGEARITSPWTVEIRDPSGGMQTLTTRSIVIAAGARPFVPPIPGLDQLDVLTSDNIWNLRQLPRRLVVLGGGPIGCELAQCFARLGSTVTQVEMLPRLMVREDPEVSELVERRFREEGVRVLTGHKALRFESDGCGKRLIAEHAGAEVSIEFDAVLCAVGRVANTDGYGLADLGIPVTKQRTVEVNEFLQTIYPNILACGDVAGPYQFTHTASHTAWYAAVNGLFGGFKRFKVDYSVIPWATFTEPEVARVGLNETEAREKGVAFEVTTYDIGDLDRAIADDAAYGFVKVLTVPGKDRVLGATIVGEHAGELIGEFITAMRRGIGLNKILGTIHIYPTLSEANKYLAGNWKRNHQPLGLLAWAETFHAWRRG